MSSPANEPYHRYHARCWALPRTDAEIRAEAEERNAVRGNVGAWTRAEELRKVLAERAAGTYCAACGFHETHPEHLYGHRCERRGVSVTTTWRNDNPDTIYNKLAARLRRQPTDAEVRAEVARILSTPARKDG